MFLLYSKAGKTKASQRRSWEGNCRIPCTNGSWVSEETCRGKYLISLREIIEIISFELICVQVVQSLNLYSAWIQRYIYIYSHIFEFLLSSLNELVILVDFFILLFYFNSLLLLLVAMIGDSWCWILFFSTSPAILLLVNVI